MNVLSVHRPLLLAAALLFVAPSYGADTRSERLWLPANASHLRPFLQMAVNLALEEEDCNDVLYARLNEYRTIYEEPTFTILCKKDAKTTYNRVVPITEVDPEYFAKIQQSEDAANTASTLTPEIEALRRQLLSPSSAASSAGTAQSAPAAASAVVNEDPNDLTLDLEPETPAASTPAPAQ
tara:strand:- start:471 stop:1013 length:543 start_codon:yes stop_codon:yes gene_type:complete